MLATTHQPGAGVDDLPARPYGHSGGRFMILKKTDGLCCGFFLGFDEKTFHSSKGKAEGERTWKSRCELEGL